MSKQKEVLLVLKPSEIKINGNVRTTTDKAKDEELAKSVAADGVLEPLLVRKDGNNYVLISGHRRLAAAKKAKATVPVRVMDVDEDQARGIQIVENLHRRDLTPLEEAEGFKDLIESNGTQPIWDHKGKKILPSVVFNKRATLVAKTVGKTLQYVVRTLRLLELPKQVIEWIRQGKLTAMHGMLLIDLTEEGREKIIKSYLDFQIKNLAKGDVFPVSELKRQIDKMFSRKLEDAIFPIDCEFAGEVACIACPLNSGNSMELFGGAKVGNCRDSKCFKQKENAFWRQEKLTLEKKVPKQEHETGVNKFVPVKFMGYSRMTINWGEAPSNPETIKGYPIITPPAGILGKTVMKGAFGWTLIKPTSDKKGRKGKIGLVVLDSKLAAKHGVKAKAVKAKVETDHELEAHVRKGIDGILNELADAELRKLKPSKALLYDGVFEGIYREYQDEWKDVAVELLGKKLKAAKGANPLAKLSIEELGLMLFVHVARYDHELLGLNKDAIMRKHRAALVDEYVQKKNAETSAEVTKK